MIPGHKRAHIDESSLVSIKKECDVDFPFSGYFGTNVEEKSSIEVLSSGNLEKAIESLSNFMRDIGRDNNPYKFLRKSLDISILTPIEIDQFVKKSISYKDNSFYKTILTYYLDELIKSSYNAGNNIFNLDLTEIPYMSRLIDNFKAEEERPLKLNLIGDIGSFSFKESSNIELDVIGSVDSDFGKLAKNIKINIEGSAGSYFAVESNNIIANINGAVGPHFGVRSWGLITEIKGSVGSGFGYDSNDFVASVYGKISRGILDCANNSILFVQDESNFPSHLSQSYVGRLNSRGTKILSGDKISTHTKYQELQRIMEEKFQ